MKTIVTPTMGRVLVRLLKEPERTAGGLYIPSPEADITVRRGIVVACGEDSVRALVSMPGGECTEPDPEGPRFPPGTAVLVSRLSGVEIEVDGEKLRLVLFEDVLATVQSGE